MNYPNILLGSPKVIAEGVRYLGINEIKGKMNNATIMSWAKDVGVQKDYTSDEVAWCGLYVAKVVQKAGFQPVTDPLWALNWRKFGTKQTIAMLGDVLVFTRENGGHVGFYVAEDDSCFHVLGGNQSDSVSIIRIEKKRCVGIRRCDWKIAQPETVRKYIVAANGKISTNEA
ncbi:TIGR02594 family protein [Chryseobacterium ginsengisoli]|uniref:TIGR02594 family protein n=1 Tax=Chryseobacterium ginsengisoli TaxID=363853 RepID=A0ABP9MRT9_9FLAO